MADSMNEKDVQKYLAAFADGELDVQDNLRVLEHARMNPQAARRVMHQQQLRSAVARSMAAQTPALPDAVRAEIEARSRACSDAGRTVRSDVSSEGPGDAIDADTVDMDQGRVSVLTRIGRWMPAAIAACLLIGAAWLYMFAHAGAQVPADARQVEHVSQMLSPAVQTALTSRHRTCTSTIERLVNSTRFPDDVDAMAPVVDAFLGVPGHAYPVLDLNAIGYAFEAAGECRSPGSRAVHLVYQPTNAATGSISLWISADQGQLDHLAEDWLYKVADSDTARSLVVWRHDGMIYYLTGESGAVVEDAARTLAMRD